ncbi:efflux RND transporter periplasmic adaptor subunit [Sphingobacterium cavernae]|uniref:efflux RND transporter periplasmic adaptor subunit n=1 Tax=Sphingobacterium cavernae TaxID=2592657 RepID=UPI00122FB564|nr:efflux RND transporter periplasmic adaptor subunit [Sphingobacterium cavernae]
MKYISFLLFSFLTFSCNQEKTNEQSTEPKVELAENELVLSPGQLKTIGINIGTIEKKQLAGLLQLNGKVDVNPDYKVSISSTLGGHITSINALPGKAVKKGEVILNLEDQQFIPIQQDYLTTQAALLSVQPNYERQKELNNSKSTSDKVMQQAETEYKSLLAIKRGLEEKLRLININPFNLTSDNIKRSVPVLAPFNGVISKVFVNKGRYVSSTDVLVELINPQGFLLNITVFEKDLPKIETGQIIDAYTNENPDTKFRARIITKGTSINDNGSSEIIAQLTESTPAKLVDGLYINAKVALDNIDAYTVPNDAVVTFEGKSYIFESKENNKYILQEVEAGESNNGFIEVKNYADLLNKKIVSKGAYDLLMALKNKAEES